MGSMAYLQVTRGCEHHCRFCSNPPTGRHISLEECKGFIDSFAAEKRFVGVILTGGEPTLNPKLPEVIRYACDKGLTPRIITNGSRTSDPDFLKLLMDNGLNLMHLSMYSHKPEIEAYLRQKEDTLDAAYATIENARRLGVRIQINSVINRYNADHLSENVRAWTRRFPFLTHFVWNMMDPLMSPKGTVSETIHRLGDFELELHHAMRYLDETGRTFRVERVPLCYMAEYAHHSTETRKIVKDDVRWIKFLDDRDLVKQDKTTWWGYGKAPACSACSLNDVCVGLWQIDKYYSSKELTPVFIPKDIVIGKILGGWKKGPDPIITAKAR